MGGDGRSGLRSGGILGLRRMLLHPQEGEDEGVTCPDRRGGDAGLCWWCEP